MKITAYLMSADELTVDAVYELDRLPEELKMALPPKGNRSYTAEEDPSPVGEPFRVVIYRLLICSPTSAIYVRRNQP